MQEMRAAAKRKAEEAIALRKQQADEMARAAKQAQVNSASSQVQTNSSFWVSSWCHASRSPTPPFALPSAKPSRTEGSRPADGVLAAKQQQAAERAQREGNKAIAAAQKNAAKQATQREQHVARLQLESNRAVCKPWMKMGVCMRVYMCEGCKCNELSMRSGLTQL